MILEAYTKLEEADTLEGVATPLPAPGEYRGDRDRCRDDMGKALQLLGGDYLSSLVDFDAFFFLTDNLAVGSTLGVPAADETDNIDPPEASLERFASCGCELIDVDGTAYFAAPGSNTVMLDPVDQLSVPALKAVAFGLRDFTCPLECPDSYFGRAVRALRRALREKDDHDKKDECSLANQLSTRNLRGAITLTVGGLVLRDVDVIGALGGVLVLASEELERFYFVRVRDVEALG